MLVLGFALAWFGYDVASWGYVLLKGWNITFLQWSSPLHPYQFPPNKGDPPDIPLGKLWPNGKTTGQAQGNNAAQLEADVTSGTP